MEIVVPAHYQRRLKASDFVRIIAAAGEELEALRGGGPDLLDRTRTSRRTISSDGWPRSTRPRIGGSGSAVTSPVEAAVVAEEDDDPLWPLAIEMCEALRVALDLLRKANGAWHKSIPLTKECWKCGEMRVADDEPCVHCRSTSAPAKAANCLNHERYELTSAVWKAGRCQFCYRHRSKHDRDAPEEVLRELEAERIERELRRAA